MDNRTLIDNISRQTGIGRDKVQDMLACFYGIAAECCVAMDTIVIPGFGQFEPKKRKERLAVHPSTGRRLLVPPKLVMGFRPSALMKSTISGQEQS